MSKNIFFEQKGPFLLSEIFVDSNLKIKISDIKSLHESNISDMPKPVHQQIGAGHASDPQVPPLCFLPKASHLAAQMKMVLSS